MFSAHLDHAFGGTPSALAIRRIGCRNDASRTFQRALRVERLRLVSATLVVVSSMPYFLRRLRVKSRCCG